MPYRMMPLRTALGRVPATLVDGIEGVADVLDLGAASVWTDDGDDVETGRVVEKAVAFQIGRGKAGKTALFGMIDGFGGMALLVGLTRFHFDEDDGAAVDGYEVQFS